MSCWLVQSAINRLLTIIDAIVFMRKRDGYTIVVVVFCSSKTTKKNNIFFIFVWMALV